MKKLYFLSIIFVITSCGGGGGGGGGGEAPSVPFAITMAPNSISVDEDNIYSGSLAATANESVTLSYAISTTTSNGEINISSSTGRINYTPNSNFNGQDSFTYSVTASEKSVVQSSTVTITINPINDPPFVTILNDSEIDENNLLFDQNPSFSLSFEDIDNSVTLIEWSQIIDKKPNNLIELNFENEKDYQTRTVQIKGLNL